MAVVYFVVPWYPARPTGGAEYQARHTVQQLRRHGVDARVLTTCVPDFRADWGVNVERRGAATVEGVPLERFPVDGRDWQLFDQVNLRIMRGEPVTPSEECVYVEESIRSRALEKRLGQLSADATCVFMPYMFGTTYWGMRARPGWLLPCLHDEPYAHMAPIRETFAAARGVLCNSSAERDLVRRTFDPRCPVLAVGEGVPIDGTASEPNRFRERTGVDGPFLLSVGRKDHGKNVEGLLVDFGAYAARRDDLKLVLIGAGTIPIPAALRPRVIDLGFVDEEVKRDAYAAAVALCVSSLNESFSLVLMESWLAGRPGLVNARCAVTREHVRSAAGGLAYDGTAEFVASLEWIVDHPDAAAGMGRNGGEYVRRNFDWDIVVARLRRALGI